MAKPKNKAELEAQSTANFQRLITLIEQIPNDKLVADFPEGTMNRNIRDIIMHLHHWHLMMLGWYKVGMNGEKPAMPAKGYTWKMTPQLNHHIWDISQNTSTEEALALYSDSHARVHALITAHTDNELFEKKRYHWTGSTSLGAYLISNTASHYDWAYKLIKKALK